MNIESIIELTIALDSVAEKFGYKLSENHGQQLWPDIGKDGGLTQNYWLRIEPKTQEETHKNDSVSVSR